MNTLPDAPSNQNASRLLLICISIHLAIDFALMYQAWFWIDYQLLVGIALPLSQCSLAVIWALSSRANLVLRFFVPPVTAMFCWYVLSRLLMWGLREPAAAAWALVLAVQVLVILVLFHLDQVVRFLASRFNGSERRAQVTFNLQTLMLWSTVIACGFGFVQFGRDKWQWDATVADWEYIHAMPVIGVFNAQLAMLWLWALARGSWQWRSTKIVIAVVVIGLMGYLLPRVLDLTTSSHALEVDDTLILAAVQSLVVFVSLAIAVVAFSMRRPPESSTSDADGS